MGDRRGPGGSQLVAQYETVLRESELWRPGQYVDATELADATRVALAEPAELPHVLLVREEDERVWRPEDYGRLPKRTRHGPGYTLLRGVHLVSPGAALTRDGRFIDDRFTRLNPRRLSTALERELRAGAQGRSEWPVAEEPVEEGILISGAGMSVFGHQLLDFMPGLAMLDEFGVFGDWPLLLPASAPDWVPALVEAFSTRPREIRRFGSHRRLRTEVGRLCVPWLVRSPAIHPAVAPVFERIAAAGRGRGTEPASRKLCLLRGGGKDKRRLTNAEAVEAFLVGRGLTPFQPERLDFLDQVRAFASAAVVVGEAGSALHGTVFARPGTTTVEMRPPSYSTRGQPAIAVLRGHTFTSVVGDQPPASRMSHDPWTLEVDALERRLDDLGL